MATAPASISPVVASQREAARILGISHTALQKAVRSGRVSAEPAGGWSPTNLRAQLDASADPARTGASAAHARATAAPAPLSKPSVPISEPAQRTSNPSSPEVPVDRLGPRPTGGLATFQDARTANEVLKAQERRLRLDERRGKLVDKGRALLLVQRFAREERDALLGWPARVAALLAAQLGVDPHQLQTLLDQQLREHLLERSRIAPAIS